MSKKIKLRIWRGDTKDGALKDVEVEANEGEVVLDVIHRVQATQMGDLAVPLFLSQSAFVPTTFTCAIAWLC